MLNNSNESFSYTSFPFGIFRTVMDTQLLSAFVEVADCGSFTVAADALHLSQPAVSKRIHALEEQIGAPLFDRVGRQVGLTDAGRALLPYARKALQDIEDGRRALSQLSGEVRGRLSIGTSHHIGLHRLPAVLRAYTQRYPEVDLDLHFMDSEVACEAVLAGKLELGIVTLPLVSIPNLELRAGGTLEYDFRIYKEGQDVKVAITEMRR